MSRHPGQHRPIEVTWFAQWLELSAAASEGENGTELTQRPDAEGKALSQFWFCSTELVASVLNQDLSRKQERVTPVSMGGIGSMLSI